MTHYQCASILTVVQLAFFIYYFLKILQEGFHKTRRGPHRGPRTPVCAPLEAGCSRRISLMIWRQHALTCRAALPTYSIGMRLQRTHTLARTHARTHAGAQHSHGDMRPADAATVSEDSFLTALLSFRRIKLLSATASLFMWLTLLGERVSLV